MRLKRHNLSSDGIPGLVKSLRSEPGEDQGVRERVEDIIGRVRHDGDKALVALTREFDCPDFSEGQLRVQPEELAAATAVAPCLLYTSDAADDLLCVDLGGRRII